MRLAKAQARGEIYDAKLVADGVAEVHRKKLLVVRGGKTNGDYRTLSGAEILEQQGIHLIRVPTIEPILNDQWFIDQLDRAQFRFEVKHCNDLH